MRQYFKEAFFVPKVLLKWYGFKGISCHLSGIVSRDSDAIRIRIRIVRCQRPAKRHKHNPCETKARFSTPPPPLLTVGSQESVLKVAKQGQFHAAIRMKTNGAAIRVPKVHLGDGRYRGETFVMRNR